ncbi:hypothetical protein NE237_031555 [Protea cynaroides]|uniref:Uncharacterized protein n=1 Tax=Protea cynaroides TaxID=273540 RepID=A0A9Q0L1H0_9MAGN|nr:hypothetical protein NE237_031555 [Protea cynaroides]
MLRWWHPPDMLQRMWCLLRMSVSGQCCRGHFPSGRMMVSSRQDQKGQAVRDLALPSRWPLVWRTSSGRIMNDLLLRPQPMQPSCHMYSYPTLVHRISFFPHITSPLILLCMLRCPLHLAISVIPRAPPPHPIDNQTLPLSASIPSAASKLVPPLPVPSPIRIVPLTLPPAPVVPPLSQLTNSSPFYPFSVIQHLETACYSINLSSTVEVSPVFSPLARQGPCGSVHLTLNASCIEAFTQPFISPNHFEPLAQMDDVVKKFSNHTPVLPIETLVVSLVTHAPSNPTLSSINHLSLSRGRVDPSVMAPSPLPPPAISDLALLNSLSLRPTLPVQTRTSPRFSASTGQSFKLPPIDKPLPPIAESFDVNSIAMTNDVVMEEDLPSPTDPWYLQVKDMLGADTLRIKPLAELYKDAP